MADPNIYHYTSLEALKGIVQENCILSFWATHYEYLNDLTEGKRGMELLQEFFPNKQINKIPDFFLVSFSQNANSARMWKEYANNGNGVLLRFDRNEIINYKIKRNDLGWGSVFYDTKLIESQLTLYNIHKKELEDIESIPPHSSIRQMMFRSGIEGIERVMKTAYSLLPLIKEEKWKDEREERLISQDKSTLNHRVRDGKKIPHITINLDGKLLKEIFISSNISDEEKQEMEDLLNKNGFNNVNLTLIDIPEQD